MITHKQYPNHHIFETEIGGRTFTVETGKVAELCNGECICRYGDTVAVSYTHLVGWPKYCACVQESPLWEPQSQLQPFWHPQLQPFWHPQAQSWHPQLQ